MGLRHLNVFLCGQKFFGQETLKMLLTIEDVSVVGVSAPIESANGRPDRLRQLAHIKNIPCMIAGNLNAHTLPAGIDLIVAAHSHDYISPQTLHKTAIGGIGYHPSLLPVHRGRDAVYWTIHTNDKVAGGTVYWLSDKVDGGPIAGQDYCFVRPGDTPIELWIRDLQPLGLSLLYKVIRDIQKSLIISVPQDETLATWEPSFGRPPLFRPDLPRIGAAPEGFEVRVTMDDLHR